MMPDGPPTPVLRPIETLFHVGRIAGLDDGRLIDRFLDGPVPSAESAFAALVDRHGPMVGRVCRQILRDPHAADDAFQATFLVLARKASSIRDLDSIAGWLHATASRISLRSRADEARRRLRERRVAERATALLAGRGDRPSETWPELHEELARLPEKYRLPIVLCHLEGLTHEQAAQRIACPVRTIQTRLNRGRSRLRDRLIRRGLGPSAATLLTSLTSTPGEAAISHALITTTIQAATRYAAGGIVAASVPASVAALVRGALNAMFREKLTAIAAATLVGGASLAGIVAGGMSIRAEADPDPQTPTTSRAESESSEEADGRFRVEMAGGATIEVVAISTSPSGPDTWWRPDGTPLDEAPADPVNVHVNAQEHPEERAILIRATRLPEGATLDWSPSGAGGYGTRNVLKDGRPVSDMRMKVAMFRPDEATSDLRVELAAGPWETEASDSGQGASIGRGEHTICFARARPDPLGTTLAVAVSIADRDVRVVAIDRDGNVQAPARSSGGGAGRLWMFDLEFRRPPDQIERFEVQSRPFEDAVIRGIALQPRRRGG